MAQQTADRGASRIGAAGIGVGGIIVAAFSRAPWMQVSYFDDRVGGGVRALSGAQWSTEASAVALLLLAAAVAAALSPLNLLVSGADPERVRALLTAGAEEAQAREGTISAMAEITSIQVNPAYLVLTLLGFLLAAAGGAVVAARPGVDSAKLNKYETEAVRRQKIGSDLEENPDSGRVLWDALDADIDPTDPAGGVGEGVDKRR